MQSNQPEIVIAVLLLVNTKIMGNKIPTDY